MEFLVGFLAIEGKSWKLVEENPIDTIILNEYLLVDLTSLVDTLRILDILEN